MPHDDTILTRKDLARELTALGYPITAAGLGRLATVPGEIGGPPFMRFGRHALYRWADAVAWAKLKAGAPVRTTAERHVARQAVAA